MSEIRVPEHAAELAIWRALATAAEGMTLRQQREIARAVQDELESATVAWRAA